MPETTEQKPTVTIHIERGPATPAQKTAFRRLFSKLIAQVKDELHAKG